MDSFLGTGHKGLKASRPLAAGEVIAWYAEFQVQTIPNPAAGPEESRYQVALVALQSIPEGQEVLLDYGGTYAAELEKSPLHAPLTPTSYLIGTGPSNPQ